jgi:hypothetical protein
LKIDSEQEPDIVNKLIQFSNFVRDKLDKLALEREELIAEKKHYYE